MTRKLASIGNVVWMSVVLVAFWLLPAMAYADSGDPLTFNEDTEYTLSPPFLIAGDVVICEVPSPCSLSMPTTWSDVLVFYNSDKGPYVPDATEDANRAFVFSDDSGSLATFLANSTGLSSNHFAIAENPTGLTSYSEFLINSPETVPEPGTVTLLGAGLLGVAGVISMAKLRKLVNLSS